MVSLSLLIEILRNKWYPDTLHISSWKHRDWKQSSGALPFWHANFFSHFRTPVPTTESPRLAKTLASTVAPVLSKAYYSDPDQSYPYYTIYDDDVSIYKDDGRLTFWIILKNLEHWIYRITLYYIYNNIAPNVCYLCFKIYVPWTKCKNWEIEKLPNIKRNPSPPFSLHILLFLSLFF